MNKHAARVGRRNWNSNCARAFRPNLCAWPLRSTPVFRRARMDDLRVRGGRQRRSIMAIKRIGGVAGVASGVSRCRLCGLRRGVSWRQSGRYFDCGGVSPPPAAGAFPNPEWPQRAQVLTGQTRHRLARASPFRRLSPGRSPRPRPLTVRAQDASQARCGWSQTLKATLPCSFTCASRALSSRTSAAAGSTKTRAPPSSTT